MTATYGAQKWAPTVVYSSGLCMASVCSKEPVPDMLRSVNLQNPTGISSRWELSKNPTFASGEPNPMQCPDDPDRKHYLLEC